MPRMFTVTHRKKLHVRTSDPKFHGAKCEAIYQQGMKALRQLKMYQDAIRYARRPGVRFRRNSTFALMLDNEWWDHKSIEEYRREVLHWTACLRKARVAYTEEHSKRHNQPLRFEVKDADGNRVDLFVTYEAAKYCKLYSGLGATIERYEGDK